MDGAIKSLVPAIVTAGACISVAYILGRRIGQPVVVQIHQMGQEEPQQQGTQGYL